MEPLTRFGSDWIARWDQFWFSPRSPIILSGLRIFTGSMLLYMHLVLASDLMAWIGPDAWISPELSQDLHDGTFGIRDGGRSYLSSIVSPFWLWFHHIVVICVTAMFAAGFLTRITAPLSWFFALTLVHRLTGALFGLDQISLYCAMYLMLSRSGSLFSIDNRLRRRLVSSPQDQRGLNWFFPDTSPSISNNIATRLLQIHLCTMYLFGGLSKARGGTWWDGTAVWYSLANAEYQSIDMTWIADWPRIFSAISHGTLFWEIFYVALIWPRATRPIMLALAVMVHGGIALFLGMITFGLMMIAANSIFIPPEWISRYRSESA